MTRARDLADSADKDIAGTVVLDDITLSNDISIADGGKALFGDGGDLQIYHDGSNNRIVDSGTGSLYIQGQQAIILANADASEFYATFDVNGAATLRYDNAQKLATTSTGVDITGDATFADNGKAIFGAGSDLQIWHDGYHSNIKESGAGSLLIDGDNIYFRNGAGTENYADFIANGAVTLRHNNLPKLATTSTGVDVTGKTTSDAVDLTAIAKDISDTAVDVFVYDTSKDSDGGAWRKRTQNTSWYNETLNTATRGSRKEFPAVAVVVVESGTVTIYDGDDPDLPMWMVFDGASGGATINMLFNYNNPPRPFTCCSLLNAQLVVGTNTSNGALAVIDFLKDNGKDYNGTAGLHYYRGSIEQRNDTLGFDALDNTYQTVNRANNDVAMTVLPNAPIDAATGLPVPTIAVATDGGLSVIRDDGTVANPSGQTGYENVDIAGSRCWFSVSGTSSSPVRFIDLETFQNGDSIPFSYTWPSLSGAPHAFSNYTRSHTTVLPDGVVIKDDQNLLLQVFSGPETGYTSGNLTRLLTSTYSTGWMNGDIKLATLSDTDDTNVTGSELVTNGTFASDTSGWTLETGTASVSSGAVTIDPTNYVGISQSVTVEVGKTYTISFDITATTTTGRMYIGNSVSIGTYKNISGLTVGTHAFTITASTSDLKLALATTYQNTGTVTFDNISVRLAEEDRSVNGNGLQVFGTVTKDPVATGADLVGYSGFSGSNYLEQPYNSDLDFGTGDFCVMGWVKSSSTGNEYILSRTRKGDGANPRFGVRGSTDTSLALNISGSVYADTGVYASDQWQHFVFLRQNGTIYGYINGEQKSSQATSSGTLTLSESRFFIGIWGTSVGSNSLAFGGSIALLRISATAPTAEQIAKIYEDEKVLFQEGAQATLYGSSDAVTALAHDDTTELLHVGTSAGRSVFQGLRRVDNTTDAVGAAISASNGLVAED